MKKIFSVAKIILCLTMAVSSAILFGCDNKNKTVETNFGKVYFTEQNAHYQSLNFFDTSIDFYIEKTFDENEQNTFLQMVTEIENYIFTTENLISVSNVNSEIYRFNNLVNGESITISDITKDIILKCQQINNLTNKFSPTLLPVANLWKLSALTYDGVAPENLPDTQTLQKLTNVCNFSNVNLTNNTLTKNVEGVIINDKTINLALDFGGIAKGYITDYISTILQNNGYTNGYINFGGSSLKLLEHCGKFWTLSIKNPRGEGSILTTENVNNLSVSTSGDYNRFYIKNDVRYSHLIDTNTLSPKQNNVTSVTVVGEGGYFVDAISTAIALMDVNDAISFVKTTLPNYKVFILTEEENNKIYTNVPQNLITLTNSSYTVINF